MLRARTTRVRIGHAAIGAGAGVVLARVMASVASSTAFASGHGAALAIVAIIHAWVAGADIDADVRFDTEDAKDATSDKALHTG